MPSEREVEGSPKYQGADESTPYKFNWEDMGTPTDPVVWLKDDVLEEDVSEDQLEGEPSIEDMVVITPSVGGIVPGHLYRLFCRATVAGKALSSFLRIIGEE